MTQKRFFPILLLRQAALTAACGVLLLSACTDDDMIDIQSAKQGLSFTVTQRNNESAAQTRTFAVTGADIPLYLHSTSRPGIVSTPPSDEAQTRGLIREEGNFHETFRLLGYAYDEADGFNTSTSTPNYLYNIPVNRIGDTGMKYAPTNSYYLPHKGTDVTFFAYAPGDADWYLKTFVDLPEKNSQGTPTFGYTTPNDSRNHQDLCVTNGVEAKGGTQNVNIPIKFYHI